MLYNTQHLYFILPLRVLCSASLLPNSRPRCHVPASSASGIPFFRPFLLLRGIGCRLLFVGCAARQSGEYFVHSITSVRSSGIALAVRIFRIFQKKHKKSPLPLAYVQNLLYLCIKFRGIYDSRTTVVAYV